MYSWGKNDDFQCGNGPNTKHVYTPKKIEALSHKKINSIKCGYSHNVVRTNDNEYYLWGHNGYHQCIINTDDDHIETPNRLHPAAFFNSDQEIIDIYPGFLSTQILLMSPVSVLRKWLLETVKVSQDCCQKIIKNGWRSKTEFVDNVTEEDLENMKIVIGYQRLIMQHTKGRGQSMYLNTFIYTQK